MSQFFENLWNSIFTPGPTPTLLVATNASFAALQVVLLALFIATYSVHFVVLSILCGGLWWAINWFANEVRQAQDERETDRNTRQRPDHDRGKDSVVSARESDGMGTDDDTEIEPESDERQNASTTATAVDDLGAEARSRIGASLSPGNQKVPAGNRSFGDGAESSTDSEWEKIEQGR